MSSRDDGTRETAREVSRRRFAKMVVVALGVAGFAGAGFSGALASHGSDDAIFTPSGGSVASGGSGGSGWDDDWGVSGSIASGGSGGSGWDDDWDDDGWDDD
jgi:hypothetical protein